MCGSGSVAGRVTALPVVAEDGPHLVPLPAVEHCRRRGVPPWHTGALDPERLGRVGTGAAGGASSGFVPRVARWISSRLLSTRRRSPPLSRSIWNLGSC